MASNKPAPPTKVAILGTGAFAQGLCSLAVRSGANATYSLVLGSRRVEDDAIQSLPSLSGIPIVSFDAALQSAEIVILAVPVGAYARFVEQYREHLARKVVVDVCNPWGNDVANLNKHRRSPDVETSDKGSEDNCSSAAGWLQDMLGSSTYVVKSLNNISSYSLIHGDTLTEHFKTVVAADDFVAANKVQDFVQALGVECRAVPMLSYAARMEKRQSGILPEWQFAAILMLATWIVCHLYSFLRYNYVGKNKWSYVTMWISNKSLAWAALWGMGYTFIPGVLVCYMQLVRRRATVRLPQWLKCWMDMRKQLGLISLFVTMLHLLFSIFLFMPAYYPKLWEQDDHMLVPMINGTNVNRYGLANQKKLAATQGPTVTLLPTGVVTFGNVTKANLVNVTASVFANLSSAATAQNVTTPMPVVIKHVGGLLTLGSRLNKWGELSMLTGIIAGVLMLVTGGTSVPCITPKLNWNEWRLLQPNLSWWCIILSEIHVLLLGAKAWPRYKTEWPMLMPTITLLSTAPIMGVLLFKGLLLLPPLSIILKKIRTGKIGQAGEIPDYAHIKIC